MARDHALHHRQHRGDPLGLRGQHQAPERKSQKQRQPPPGRLAGRRSPPAQPASFAQQVDQLRVQVEQAKAIVESLGQLKGAAMKAGQLLSMELRDVLPPEVIAVLSQLQASGSTEPAVTRRYTVTGRACPMRCARPIAWSSAAGFHHGSAMIT